MKNLTVNKAELISKIKTLEGLTNEEKADLIGLLRQHKKYGLVWEDKVEDVEERLRDELPILREMKDKAISAGVVQSDLKSDCSEYKDFQSDKRITNADTHGERIANPLEQAPNHILIEGDNLEALTALSYTHEGKIDVIYIDPPYNTGNKDFVYNDSYVDAEDGYRHSKWLSFMNKRLKIAKKLLSDKGVIFISVDDNEQAQLRLLLDEIFRGKSLDRGTLIWENRGSTKGFSKIVKNHEYILGFSNNPEAIKSLYNKNFPANDDLIEERLQIKRSPKNPICQIKFPKGLPIRDVEDVRFEGYVGNGTNRIDIISGEMEFRGGKLQNDVVLEASFPYRNQTEKYFKALETGEPVYDTKGQQWLEVFFSKTGVPHYSKQRGFTILSSLLDNVPNSGFSDLKALKLETKFSNPKPVLLIYKLLSHFSTSNYVILDFFAGSGTTLHATMQLNAEDGGHRKCILVTNNENNICEEVTYERNKRVINGYTTPKGVEVAGLKANTLRYYKTDYISRDRTQKNMRALVAAATDMLCIKEDLYEEQKMFGRVKVNPRVMRYFSDGRKHMLVVYREEVVDMLVEEIKSLPLTGKSGFPKLKIYIFSPGRYAFDDNFYEVRDKVQLVALPAAIYDAYMKVLPKRREQMIDEEKKEETQMPQDLFEEAEKGGEV